MQKCMNDRSLQISSTTDIVWAGTAQVWVNICDLLDAQAINAANPMLPRTIPRRFPSERALASYTIKERKIYPKGEAKKRGAVKALMAQIFRR